MSDQYAVGDHTTTHCTQCKMRRNHAILAMDGARIAQVKCTTCGSRSTFTPPAAAKKVRAPRAKKGAGVHLSVASRWAASMAAATGKESRYTMTATYRIGDILFHEQFGKGIVLKLAPKKCLVLFQDQERLMASANASECVYWPLSVNRIPATRR